MCENKNILVSICCITYNHEHYIRDALDSFLMQQTDFSFEILIHDDASTDNTANIIREYEEKFPGIIKPIYQQCNQYSRGVVITRLNLQRAQGKYVALCEGDDYWTDPKKLQLQTDYMESHPYCSLCTHSAKVVSEDARKVGKMRPARRDTEFTASDMIIGGGDMIATNSMFFPYEKWQNCPDFFKLWPVGDYPLAIYLSIAGEVHYIDQAMSAYRTGISGQWTAALRQSQDNLRNHFMQIDEKLEELDELTGFQYSLAIKKRIRIDQIYMGNLYVLDNPIYRDAYEALPLIYKIKVWLQYQYPQLYDLAKKIKGTY